MQSCIFLQIVTFYICNPKKSALYKGEIFRSLFCNVNLDRHIIKVLFYILFFLQKAFYKNKSNKKYGQ